jgi:hypothetical protein
MTDFKEPLPYKRPLKEHRVLVQFEGESEPRSYSIKEFEERMGVIYAPHLVFPSEKSYLKIRKACKELFAAGKISKRAEWIGVHFRNQIDTGDVRKTSIRYIDSNRGFGLFAEEIIKLGEVIGEYTGLVRRCFPFFALPNPYCFRYPLYNMFWGSYTIDAEKYTNEISFINHQNTDPNCESVVSLNHHILHVLIRAKRDIAKGEELAFDYGNEAITLS